MKNWVWFNLNKEFSAEKWEAQFRFWHEHKISGILPNIYNSRKAFYKSNHVKVEKDILGKILPIARKFNFEVHGWMWTMPNNDEDFAQKYPEAFVVNRLGESALEKPAYVNYYRFMCPNRDEVKEYLSKIVTELAQIEMLGGIHLDYIRYPDVILPVGLQPKYNLVQDREYPQFDYCYCNTCCRKFKELHGIDALKISTEEEQDLWNQFRYDSISNIVNEVILPIAEKAGKKVSAAVFPNWTDVRQQWHKWNIHYFFPMLYHKFYHAKIDWLGEKVAEEKALLKEDQKLFAGLFAKFFDMESLVEATKLVKSKGADGISFFTGYSLSDELWTKFAEIVS